MSFSGEAVRIDGPVSVVSERRRFLTRISEDGVPPVMSYFEPSKNTTAGQSFIELQRRRWSELVATADTVAIVGVRVRPTDAHIWGPLATASARIVYCAGKAAAHEFREWARSARRNDDDRVLKTHFREGLVVLCSESGLS